MNQRGIAMPAALIALLILTSLMIAFALLASTEPTIASNQSQAARARALAESGVERAIWGLSVGSGTPGGVDAPAPGVVAGGPYNGAPASYVAVTAGGFVAKITGSSPTQVNVESVGWTPDNTSNGNAHRKILVTLNKFKTMTPPCTMCLGGETPPGAITNLQVGGNASINGSSARGSPPAAYCAGIVPPSTIMTTGTVNTNGTPDITAPPGGTASITGANKSTFDSFTLTDDDMAMLKAFAQSHGTYFQGDQHWNSPPPNGIVFVDTPSGNVFTNNSPTSDVITVDIHGNWSEGWKGWLIVAGTVDISGDVNMRGLIYGQNDVQIHGNGNQRITGAVIATNRKDTYAVSSQVDSQDIGNGRLTYDCPAVRDGGGTIPQSWFVKSGTYKEVSGP